LKERKPVGALPWRFVAVLIVVSTPFWLLGALPGRFVPRVPLIDLPPSALVAFAPMFAALILRWHEQGAQGARMLMRRAFDFRRIQKPVWYLPIVFTMPLLMAVEFGVMKVMGRAVPDPRFSPLLLLFAVLFFLSAVGEEVGWMGYAIDPLLERWPALTAAIVLGILWAVWHLISFLQTTDSLSWVFWQSLNTIGLRVLIVWIFLNTGKSVFAAVLFHTMSNISEFAFPVYGSHYDPLLTTLLVGIVAAVVSLVWGRALSPIARGWSA
jgi:membrane protease YdiL (CAAX protease family)